MSDARLWVFYDAVSKIQSNPLTKDEAQSAILKIRPGSIERFYIWTQGWQSWQPLRTYLESDQQVFVSTFTVSRANEKTAIAVAREVMENTVTRTITQTKTGVPGIDDTITSTKTFNGTNSGTYTNAGTGTGTSPYSKIMLAEETISRYMRIEEKKLAAELGVKFDADDLTISNIEKPKVDFSRLVSKPMSEREQRHDLKIEVLLISQRGKTFRTKSKNISLSGALLEDTMPFEFYDSGFDVVVLNTLTKDPKRARVKLQGKAIIAGGNRSARVQYLNPTEDQKLNLQNLLVDYLDAIKKDKKSA